MTKVLVTGGAGYIGSIAVKELLNKGYTVVVIDNLSKGIRELVDKRAQFYKGDLTNKEMVDNLFEKERPDVVMHFASYKAAGESMTNPKRYADNVIGILYLLQSMAEYNCKKIIYSSSASVYGEPKYTPIDEKHPLIPTNYYGQTKLLGERYLESFSKAHGIQYVALRYFNVVGEGGLKYIDPEPQNILPLVMEVIIGKREKLTIFGDDYDTRDGTCVRDYIDVNDLIDAHIKAMDVTTNEIINLGTEEGITVKEFLDVAKEVSKKKFRVDKGPRRSGDPAQLTASNEKAKKVLGWTPQKSFRETIEDTWNVYKNKS